GLIDGPGFESTRGVAQHVRPVGFGRDCGRAAEQRQQGTCGRARGEPHFSSHTERVCQLKRMVRRRSTKYTATVIHAAWLGCTWYCSVSSRYSAQTASKVSETNWPGRIKAGTSRTTTSRSIPPATPLV